MPQRILDFDLQSSKDLAEVTMKKVIYNLFKEGFINNELRSELYSFAEQQIIGCLTKSDIDNKVNTD